MLPEKRWHPSPNFDKRSCVVDMLVFHYTDMTSAQAALDRLCDRTAKVSAHYLIDEQGVCHQLVDEAMRAWHAGVAYWRGHSNINDRSIGIELANPGHSNGYRPFPKVQMQALVELSRAVIAEYRISPRNVLGHSDIAPARKKDPGELFDWAWLAEQGVGFFPPYLASAQKASPNALGDDGFYECLYRIGYDPKARPSDLAIAFCRHFRHQILSDRPDDEMKALAQRIDIALPAL